MNKFLETLEKMIRKDVEENLKKQCALLSDQAIVELVNYEIEKLAVDIYRSATKKENLF